MFKDKRLADRITKINPSCTLAITSKAKKLKSEGKDIVNFAAGEPDFDTPDFIKNEAIEAIKSGFTKYTPHRLSSPYHRRTLKALSGNTSNNGHSGQGPSVPT